ncbi:hypothetical protein BXZ70DRAFT_954458 [Cristinia sonorae]|uniref:Uncharacterized protein n=1 Tax=Cristinia sonorae TaxID=1940300 RepID=A0A8K0UHN4_9AGAR|nr:hypothetical protein BXZ70DRAFT_954458 [Cristinia sonorae]
MESFSWSDSFHAAFSPCLACLHLQRGPPQLPDSDDESQQQDGARIPRARPDELEGLLRDSDDVETMSLHSNMGDRDRRRRSRTTTKKKKKKHSKGIQLFGFDLFGRPPPPIHLTDDEDEDESTSALDARPRANDDRSRTVSTDTLDSDAALLDAARIDEMSAERVAEGIRREEEERRLKEERRKLRRERKELKKAALQLALAQAGTNQGADFEGFQGSGPGYGHIPSPFRNGSDVSSPYTQDEFGPFEQAQPSYRPPHVPLPVPVAREESEDPDVDGADFGAENYARRAPGGSSNGAGSDSRSGTSAASMSIAGYSYSYSNRQYQQQPGMMPFSPQDHQQQQQQQQELFIDATPTRKKKKTSKSSSRKSGRHSVSTTSQSTGPTSPPTVPPEIHPPVIVSPESDDAETPRIGVVVDAVAAVKPVSAFPSTGLRGGFGRKNSDAGVFLARRGDD